MNFFKNISKTGKGGLEIFARRPLDIVCERDWPIGLGAMLGDDGQKIKNYSTSLRFFKKSLIVSYNWASNVGLL